MAQRALQTDASAFGHHQPALCSETRERLGTVLREVYEGSVEREPIPDAQIDLLLRLRHKERDLQRSAA
jgi:hypothetical protein